jgi:hypothetical protein
MTWHLSRITAARKRVAGHTLLMTFCRLGCGSVTEVLIRIRVPVKEVLEKS